MSRWLFLFGRIAGCLNGILQLGAGLAAQVGEHVAQGTPDQLFLFGEFVWSQFQGDGTIVAGFLQVIEEAGQGEFAVAGEQMLFAVSVVGEVNIADPARIVEVVEVGQEICFMGAHMGRVEGEKQVPFLEKIDHLIGAVQEVRVAS